MVDRYTREKLDQRNCLALDEAKGAAAAIVNRPWHRGTRCRQVVQQIEEERQMFEHLEEAHDREVARVREQLHAGRGHLIAAQADQAGARPALLQRDRNGGRMHVAGRLAGRDEDARPATQGD